PPPGPQGPVALGPGLARPLAPRRRLPGRGASPSLRDPAEEARAGLGRPGRLSVPRTGGRRPRPRDPRGDRPAPGALPRGGRPLPPREPAPARGRPGPGLAGRDLAEPPGPGPGEAPRAPRTPGPGPDAPGVPPVPGPCLAGGGDRAGRLNPP